MTPQAFIAKWRDNPLTERAGAQAHFEDLCALLEVEPPRSPVKRTGTADTNPANIQNVRITENPLY